ncbi:hypothetical protein GF385_02680, partial [Candidatus Dependentiae bacterium]|nr:hypothetical protein [Candidatus Dependentiae bacterium]
MEILFKRLKSILERLIRIKDPKVFCDVLNEFCLEIFNNPKINKIIKIILKQPAKQIQNLKKLEADANEELDNSYKEVKNLIKKDEINDSWIERNINIYKNPSIHMTGPTYNKFIAMNMIQVALNNNSKTKHYRLATQQSKNISDITEYERLFPRTWEWHQQNITFNKTNEGLNNIAIKRLEDFFNCYNFNKPPNKLKENNTNLFYKSRSTLMTGYIFGKQREYYNSTNEASLPFYPEEFKQYTGRVLNAIEENIDQVNKNKEKKIKKQLIIKYNTSTSE